MHTSIMEGQIRSLRGHHYTPATHAPLFLDVEPMWRVTKFGDRLLSFWNYLVLNAIYSWGILNYLWSNTVSPILSTNTPNFMEYHRNVQGHFVEYPKILEDAFATGSDVFNLGGGCPEVTTKPLPTEVQKFIEKKESKGTIIVAFGNYVKWHLAPDDIRQKFLDGLRLLSDYRVIFQNPAEPYDMPEHVLQLGWLPQREILAHPSTKLFISHGGVKSIKETICNGVHALVFPIFGDQYYNAYGIQKLKIGDAVDKTMLTPQKLANKVRTVITETSDGLQIKALKYHMQDQIQPESDTAAFWAERIIKRQGLPREFFGRRSMDMSLVQYLCLDIIFLALAFTSALLVLLVKLVAKCVASRKT